MIGGSLRALAGPILIGIAVWAAAGTLSLGSADGGDVRIASPASAWWLLAGFGVALAVPAWRRRPSLASPALLSVLPWLPLPMAAPGLIWTGALAWVPVGLAVVAAGVSDRRAMPMSVSAGGPVRRAVVAGLVNVAVSGLVLGAVGQRLPGGDEPHYLVITQSLLRDADLRIENNHRQRDYAEYVGGTLPPDYLQRGRDGEIYSVHAPGVSVLVLPLFALFGLIGAQATIIALSGLGGGLIWYAGWQATRDTVAAWFCWAAVTGTATFLIQTVTIFPDGPAAALVAAASVVWLRVRRGEPVSAPWLVAASAALSLLPFLHTRFAVVSVGLGLAIALAIWRNGRSVESRAARAIVAFGVLPVACAAAWFLYFFLIYGTPDPRIQYGTMSTGSVAFVPTGLAGLMFDQQFGLFTYGPVLGLALVGMLRRQRSAPGHSLTALGLVALVYLMASTTYWMWWVGVPATPARLAAVILPLLAPSLAVFWWQGSPCGRTLALTLLGVTWTLSIVLFAVDHGALAWNTRGPAAAWLVRAASVVDLPRAWPSFFLSATGGDPASLRPFIAHVGGLVLVVAVVSGLMTVYARRGEADSTPERQVLAAVWWLPAVITGLSLVGWWLHGAWYRPAESQMALLRQSAASAGAWRVGPLSVRRLPGDDLPLRIGLTRVDGGLTVPTWAPLADVPPGDYRVRLLVRRLAAGHIAIRLGDSPEPLVRIEVRAAALRPAPLHIPARLGDLRFEAEPEVAAVIRGVELVPSAVRATDDPPARAWLRSGYHQIFFVDDGAYLEDHAFWVRGSGRSRLVAAATDAAGQALALRLVNGPLPNVVTMEIDDSRRQWQMRPHEQQDVSVVMPVSGTRRLSIESAAGFRPVEHGPSDDTRLLGVRVELPEWPPAAVAAQ